MGKARYNVYRPPVQNKTAHQPDTPQVHNLFITFFWAVFIAIQTVLYIYIKNKMHRLYKKRSLKKLFGVQPLSVL